MSGISSTGRGIGAVASDSVGGVLPDSIRSEPISGGFSSSTGSRASAVAANGVSTAAPPSSTGISIVSDSAGVSTGDGSNGRSSATPSAWIFSAASSMFFSELVSRTLSKIFVGGNLLQSPEMARSGRAAVILGGSERAPDDRDQRFRGSHSNGDTIEAGEAPVRTAIVARELDRTPAELGARRRTLVRCVQHFANRIVVRGRSDGRILIDDHRRQGAVFGDLRKFNWSRFGHRFSFRRAAAKTAIMTHRRLK
ncbi:MAG: hypothetical protein IPK58_05705 [Acidobacteria bacterium]|nr:hypothetical protein [Acidobacteriota bacterium]